MGAPWVQKVQMLVSLLFVFLNIMVRNESKADILERKKLHITINVIVNVSVNVILTGSLRIRTK